MSIFPDEFDPTYEDYVTKFLEYEEEGEGTLWHRGDLLVDYCEQPFRDGVTLKAMLKGLRSLASDVGRHHKTLERWRYTAEIFPPDKRIIDLSFSHHTAAAYSKKPDYWLQKAADNEWSKTQLLNAIKAAEHPEEAWVTKTVRGTASLEILEEDGAEFVQLRGIGYVIELDAKPEAPIRLGQKWGGEPIDVEVEARIRVRRARPP